MLDFSIMGVLEFELILFVPFPQIGKRNPYPFRDFQDPSDADKYQPGHVRLNYELRYVFGAESARIGQLAESDLSGASHGRPASELARRLPP